MNNAAAATQTKQNKNQFKRINFWRKSWKNIN